MRACFLGQNICALGFGVATLQTQPPLVDEQTGKPAHDEHVSAALERPDSRQPAPLPINMRPL